MSLQLITAPVELPLTLEQARVHLKVSATAEDGLILSWLNAATDQAEVYLRRALITQTWELALDKFAGREIELPKPPLQSVTSVKYIDRDGVEQTFASSNYYVDERSTPGRIVLDDAAFWPDTDVRPNAVKVRYVAGYGFAAAVPFTMKAAILLFVQYHEGRLVDEDLKRGAESLLFTDRVNEL